LSKGNFPVASQVAGIVKIAIAGAIDLHSGEDCGARQGWPGASFNPEVIPAAIRSGRVAVRDPGVANFVAVRDICVGTSAGIDRG